MSWGEEQKKEIETIRERKITVKLSDADCDRLARKCGEHMRPQTIAQYHIKQWLDDNFIMGCARLEYTGKDTAKVMDTVGGVMYVEYKNGEVRECQK